MKRRNFLAGLLGAAPAGAAAAAIAPAFDIEVKGVYLPLDCVCGEKWRVFVELDKPIVLGTPQCPRCLMVMQWPEKAAQTIKEWNLKHGFKTSIYTPRRYG